MDTPDTLNAAEAAALLHADTETVLALARRGELPGAKIGKPWVFLRSDMLEFLRERVDLETEQRRRERATPPSPSASLVVRPKVRRRAPPALPELPALFKAPSSP